MFSSFSILWQAYRKGSLSTCLSICLSLTFSLLHTQTHCPLCSIYEKYSSCLCWTIFLLQHARKNGSQHFFSTPFESYKHDFSVASACHQPAHSKDLYQCRLAQQSKVYNRLHMDTLFLKVHTGSLRFCRKQGYLDWLQESEMICAKQHHTSEHAHFFHLVPVGWYMPLLLRIHGFFHAVWLPHDQDLVGQKEMLKSPGMLACLNNSFTVWWSDHIVMYLAPF